MTEPEFIEILRENLAQNRHLLSTNELMKLEAQVRGLPEDAGLDAAINKLKRMICDGEHLLARMSQYGLAVMVLPQPGQDDDSPATAITPTTGTGGAAND